MESEYIKMEDNVEFQENENRDYSNERSEKPNRRSNSPSRSRSRSPTRRARSRSPRRRRSINMISNRVIVSNIPFEMKWQDIKDTFRKEVGDVSYVEMFETPDGRPQGSCVVELKTVELARKAIETMHRFKVRERVLVVREERDNDMRRHGGGGGGGRGGGGGMGNMQGGMMGNQNVGGGGGMPMGNNVLQQLGIDGPLSNTVFVANLDYRVTWRKLKDVFKLAGNAIKADIKVDKDGKSRGMGTVQFEKPVEAVQAISMFNGQMLYDRTMMVKLDRLEEIKPPAPKLPSGLKSIGMGLGIGGAAIQNFAQMAGVDSGMMRGGNMGMGNNMGLVSGMGGMGGGLNALGGGMNAMGAGMGGGLSGMGNLGGMSGNLAGNVAGMSSNMGNMGSGMGMGSVSPSMRMGNSMAGAAGLGMGDNFSSGMGMVSGMGSSMGGGLKDSFGGLGGMNSNLGGWGANNMNNSVMGNAGMDSNNYNSMGKQQHGERRGNSSTRPDNCTVIVKNLPYSYTWQTLKDRFQEVAEVKFAEIEKENGRSSGVGYLRFGNAADAEKAVSMMNRTRMDGREVMVRLFRN